MPVCSSFCVLICLCAQLSVRSFVCVLICLCAHLSVCSSVCTFCPSVFVYSSSVCVSITLWSYNSSVCTFCPSVFVYSSSVCASIRLWSYNSSVCVSIRLWKETRSVLIFLAAITKIIQVTAVKITLWNKQSRFKHLSKINNKNKTWNNQTF